MNKIERNSLCPCGSGMKYKRCCILKIDIDTPSVAMTVESLLSVIQFGIEHMDLLAEGAKAAKVKAVSLSNGGDTLIVDFTAHAKRSLDIKVEIASIMAYLSSSFNIEIYKDINIQYFAVRAYDDNDVEILYAISSKASAEAIAKSNSIEWLKTTLFQENTPDYRLARAKTMISDIENGLRKIINNLYETKVGAQWWDLAIDPKTSAHIKNIYNNQFGCEISDGAILINYTFTLDLKKIVSADWSTFRHLFSKKDDFENEMVELNNIRREEAHNRDITERHLIDLERIYNSLLGKISVKFPDIIVNYLVENWRFKIKEIMLFSSKCVYDMDEFNAQDLLGRHQLLIADTKAQITFWGNIIAKLKSLSPPPSKKRKHEELDSILTKIVEIQKLKLQRTENFQFDDIKEIILSMQEHLKKLDVFSKEFLLGES